MAGITGKREDSDKNKGRLERSKINTRGFRFLGPQVAPAHLGFTPRHYVVQRRMLHGLLRLYIVVIWYFNYLGTQVRK